MSVAVSTTDFGASHTVRSVFMESDGIFGYWVSEGGPPGATVELLLGREDGSVTYGAVEDAIVLKVEVFARERSFCATFSSYFMELWIILAELVVGFHIYGHYTK